MSDDASRDEGDVRLEGDTASLVFRRHLRHPPARVWAALTEPDLLRQWYMSRATIDGRAGGSVALVSGPSAFHVTGKILTWDPPRVYEHEWNVEPRAELPNGERARVRWELTPVDGGTLLVLTHARLTTKTARGFAPGTHAFLDRLAAQLDAAPLPNWMQRISEIAPAYAPK